MGRETGLEQERMKSSEVLKKMGDERREKRKPHDYIPACTWSVSNLCAQRVSRYEYE